MSLTSYRAAPPRVNQMSEDRDQMADRADACFFCERKKLFAHVCVLLP